ncbi:unnamed protein product [Rangifer tarandus platyrhynchus]|uniref:Uncharacterized protein n=2 Tax=Rangifer tarandus platyrhynchus TaxID=3082113 RepID=A0ACB0DYC1_RANTA|nr:unnamed protein product [Rangifer tarandus platyrhynchus]CAI9693174.1 unnamed protein product [Rangifer tarandus platyrhynchus]
MWLVACSTHRQEVIPQWDSGALPGKGNTVLCVLKSLLDFGQRWSRARPPRLQGVAWGGLPLSSRGGQARGGVGSRLPRRNHPAQRRITGGAPVYTISLRALVSAVGALTLALGCDPQGLLTVDPGAWGSSLALLHPTHRFLGGRWASSMWLSGPRAGVTFWAGSRMQTARGQGDDRRSQDQPGMLCMHIRRLWMQRIQHLLPGDTDLPQPGLRACPGPGPPLWGFNIKSVSEKKCEKIHGKNRFINSTGAYPLRITSLVKPGNRETRQSFRRTGLFMKMMFLKTGSCRKSVLASPPVRSLYRGRFKALEISCAQGDVSWFPWSFITFFGAELRTQRSPRAFWRVWLSRRLLPLAAFRLPPRTQREPLHSGHCAPIFPCHPSVGWAAAAPSSTLVNFHGLFWTALGSQQATASPLQGTRFLCVGENRLSTLACRGCVAPRFANGCVTAELARSAARARQQALAGLRTCAVCRALQPGRGGITAASGPRPWARHQRAPGVSAAAAAASARGE